MRESWSRIRRGKFAWLGRALVATLVVVGVGAGTAAAQFGNAPPPDQLVKFDSKPITVRAGETVKAAIVLQIADGWHINANPATPEFMIPTEVELPPGAGVTPGAPVYPLPQRIKLGFEESELSVWDGRVTIELPLAIARDAMNGRRAVVGKIKFQACNDQLCLAPAAINFALDVTIRGGRDAGAGAETTAVAPPIPTSVDTVNTPGSTPGTSGGVRTDRFSTAPPPAGTSAALDNPLTRTIDQGGILAFLTLFVIGLALNLTPCVYPMLGVTVAIFGARRAAPPLQVFGLALIYVLGMATMYSVLGLVAALTGGLFGAALQNPIVLITIGVILAALSLSMFGLYEIQMPAFLRERASAVRAVGVAGVFLSGLLVGIFAAPCVGPPIAILLAVVGTKGDPVFGFTSFFVLALGLGAPYLVLGSFSNLLQKLPRSGDWMEWVKRLFGVILLAIGVQYVLFGIAPKLAVWVVPAALVLGGGWLGFIDPSANQRTGFRVFKRVGGALAVLVGLLNAVIIPRPSLQMEEFSSASLATALASGRPAMIDFSADWCAPCRELEHLTFTDRRVIAAAKNFSTFRADLTRYDSPEAESWRKEYAISGVPTVVFLMPDGREVRESRVEGFLAADRFLERMEIASRGGLRARAEP
jgi:thioredoxin:protein disulfide reductase